MGTRIELSFRDRAILRAVAGGHAELLVGVEPDLYLDGRCCADQVAARRLARAGLIVAAIPGPTAHRVPVGFQISVWARDQLFRLRVRTG